MIFKQVAFDIGNVLLHMNIMSFIEEINIGIYYEEERNEKILKMLNWMKSRQGVCDMGASSFKDEFLCKYDYYSEKEFDNYVLPLWNKTLSPEPKMIKLVESLIDKGYEVALLSNIGFEHKAIIPDLLGSKIYNGTTKFFSCEIGVRKPTALYYKTFLEFFPQFLNCLYLDDNLENLACAKNVFQFNSHWFDLSKIDPCHLNKEIKIIKDILSKED